MAAAQTWVARVRSGNETKDVLVVGTNEAEARRQAGRSGNVISLKRSKNSLLKSGMSRNERFVFLMRLSTMIGSKFPVSDALKLMMSSFSGKIREAAKTAIPQVERGVPLGEALATDVKNFPGSIGLLIKTGSASGDTAGALREAAEFEKLIGEASKGAMFAIVRSFLYMFMALGLLIVNQYVIIPKMFDSSIMKMAKNADFSIWKSIGLWAMGINILIMVILLSLVALATFGRRIAPDKVDSFILKLPIMRDIVISQDNYIGLYRMSLLVRANVPMNEALLSCAESTRPGALKEDFKRAYGGLKRGEKWAKYMNTLHPTDRAALMLMPDIDELAKNLHYIAEQSKVLYLQRLGVISPTMDIVSAMLISIAGFIVLVVTTVPQLQLVTELMG
jgi:general secretion pathway protein F